MNIRLKLQMSTVVHYNRLQQPITVFGMICVTNFETVPHSFKVVVQRFGGLLTPRRESHFDNIAKLTDVEENCMHLRSDTNLKPLVRAPECIYFVLVVRGKSFPIASSDYIVESFKGINELCHL